SLQNSIIDRLCSDLPNAFWHRKRHVVSLSYEKDFSERKLLKPSKSPWNCTPFYVNKNSEIERRTLRLVINYKPLNTALQCIRHPIPKKKDFLKRLTETKLFSKFTLKS
ncbi:LOW QUALITY PROTEIN: hypothetical protein CFOL_v3_31003, partial [Cephalotus follicularis]